MLKALEWGTVDLTPTYTEHTFPLSFTVCNGIKLCPQGNATFFALSSAAIYGVYGSSSCNASFSAQGS